MMVAYQVLTIADVANGLLMYVAQAFLLAGSIFGLDYYVKQLRRLNENQNQGGNTNQGGSQQGGSTNPGTVTPEPGTGGGDEG